MCCEAVTPIASRSPKRSSSSASTRKRSRRKFERAALRWHARFVAEMAPPSLLRAQNALAALSALRSGNSEAKQALLGLVQG